MLRLKQIELIDSAPVVKHSGCEIGKGSSLQSFPIPLNYWNCQSFKGMQTSIWNMKSNFISSLELISRDLSEELFVATEDVEMQEMQIELWEGICTDLLPDLAQIRKLCQGGPGPEAKRLIHRVAGYAGSAALNRCHLILKALETGQIPELSSEELLDEAELAAKEGMEGMEEFYPHLKTAKKERTG